MALWRSKQEVKKVKMENGDYTPSSGGLINQTVTPQTSTHCHLISLHQCSN